MYRVKGSAKSLVEDVADPGAPAQLRRLDVARGAVQRRHVGRGELCDDLHRDIVNV